MTPPPYVAVAGPGECDADTAATAEEVGRELAARGAVIVCGGLGGAMEAACRGAKSAGGTTIGILGGSDRGDANEFVDVAIATGLGEMRNTLVVRAADAVVALSGGCGTLSEIAFALKTETPVIGLATWDIEGVVAAGDAAEAAELALRLAA